MYSFLRSRDLVHRSSEEIPDDSEKNGDEGSLWG